MSTEDFRVLTIAVTLVTMTLLPFAIWHRHKHPMVLLLAIVSTILFVGEVVAIVEQIEARSPIVWYTSPLTLAADLVALIYCALAFALPGETTYPARGQPGETGAAGPTGPRGERGPPG